MSSEYIIGSFNLRDFNLSTQSTDDSGDKIKRDYERIAKIIRRENFDVIALQEINSKTALNYLLKVINRYKTPLREYASEFGENMQRPASSRDPERYAFIWNVKRLRLIENARGGNPRYYYHAGALGLIRPPYFARFTARGLPGGANFELRLVNTHIKFGASEAERLNEFNTLVRQVLPRICDLQELSDSGEHMPAYTFLLGDFNLELNKSERSIYRIEAVTETDYTGRHRGFRTVQEEKTSLKQVSAATLSQTVADCYAHNFDHFTYDTELDGELRLVPQRVEALSKYFPERTEAQDKLSAYRSAVSDHVPIKLTVRFPQ